MTIRIKHEGLAVPMNPMFTLYIADLLAPYESEKAVTINFRDPNYSADDGGYQPVEQAIEIFQIWETNFVYYAMVSKAFSINYIIE